MEKKTIDPVTVEVIRNYFLSAAREMRSVIIRTSLNAVIYEVGDFATGMYNKKVGLIAQDPGLPHFIGSLDFCIKTVLEYLGEDNIHEGDVIISSYPYFTGSHTNDVTILKPVFVDNETFAYTACKAHWIDIGGINLLPIDSTDMYQEGLILPAVKVIKRGVVDQEIIDIIGSNTRFREEMIGDLYAQIAACEAGGKRILKAVKKWGKEVVDSAISQFMDDAEMITRKLIAEMPDGEWSAETFIDNDGITDDPVPLKLTVRIKGSNIEVDTTGSSGATKGPLNSPYSSTVAFFRCILMSITAPYYEPSEGFFRPLTVIAPEGSVTNARPPSPTMLYGWMEPALANLFHKCLVEAIPEKVVARSGGEPHSFDWSVVKNLRDGTSCASGMAQGCGQGGGLDYDGENALALWSMGDLYNIPNEILEERFPMLIERCSLRNDSGGAGEFCGGLGIEHVFRMEDVITFISTLMLTKFPPWGLKGGKSGLPGSMVANPGKPNEVKEKFIATLYKGDYLIEHTGGGGGFGDPYERDPQRILDDVMDEYVSIEKAREDYGVVIRKKGDDYIIDEVETEVAREEVKQEEKGGKGE